MHARRETGRRPSNRWVRRATFAAFALTALALIGIIGVLVSIGRETDGLRERLAAVNVRARARLSDLDRILALQMAAQRAYRLGGDEQSLVVYEDLREEEQEILRALDSLVTRVGPGAAVALADLTSGSERWHHLVGGGLSERRVEAALDSTLSLQTGPYARTLDASARLHRAILRDESVRRARLSDLEETEDRLVVFLVVPAGLGVAGLVGVGMRLHRLTLDERRLRSLAERRGHELERVAEEKRRFVRGITHDLKNPLNVIDGSAELLEMGIHGDLSGDQIEVVARIRRVAREAVAAIEDLLELSLSDDGELPLRPEPVAIRRLVDEVVEDYRGPAEAAGMQLRLKGRAAPGEIDTDPARVREVLGNLINNAIRHASQGGRIVVSVREVDRSTDGVWVAIDVEDDGPGIPEERQEDIFLEGVRAETTGGSGVGLAISRRIAGSLGGELSVASTSGRGSTFTMLLPMGRSPERA